MKRSDYRDTDDILFDILIELKEINQKISKKNSFQIIKTEVVSNPPAETDKNISAIENKSTEVECKYCGGTHRNRQSMAACAKKHKKDGEQ
jgi:L-fucose isomerase-like protein